METFFIYIVLLGMSLERLLVEISVQRFVGRFLLDFWHQFLLGDCLVQFSLDKNHGSLASTPFPLLLVVS